MKNKNFNLGFISYVLCFCMLFTYSVTAFASSDTVTSDNPVYGGESIGLLDALEITRISETELSDNIKRADLLKMLAVSSGFPQIKGEGSYFSDLSAGDEREPYLRALAMAGVIAPDKDGRIFPDGNIGMAEASAVAVKLLGYDVVADSKGGFPAGYFTVAKSIDITDGLTENPNAVLTKGMAAVLVENLLKCEHTMQAVYKTEKIEYRTEIGNGFLEDIFEVKYAEGVLEGVDISRVTGENDVMPFHIEIGGQSLNVMYMDGNIYDFLGYNVKVYYSISDKTNNRVIHIERTSENTEVIFGTGDIKSISGQSVEAYDPSGIKTKKYLCIRGIPVIYNGVATLQSFKTELIDDKNGFVRLLDNNGDKVYDIAFIDVYENHVAAQVDVKNNTVYGKYGKKVLLDTYSDDPYTVIYGADGKEVKINRIKSGDVISVFKSAEDSYQKYIRAYIVNNTVSGEIEEIENNNKIIIGGIPYEFGEDCPENTVTSPAAGQNVRLYLDYSGKIADLEVLSQTETVYGYIADIGNDSTDAFNSTVKIKIYTLDKGFMIFDLADKIRIDGNMYEPDKEEDRDSITGLLHRASARMFNTYDSKGNLTGEVAPDCVASVIRYKVNSENKISVIDTLLSKEGNAAERETPGLDNDSLFLVTPNTNTYFNRSNYTIGSNIAVNEQTTVFCYPSPLDENTDIDDELYYAHGTAEALMVNNKQYPISAFFTDADKYISDFVGCEYSGIFTLSGNENIGFAIVDKISRVYDSETGEEYDCVTVYSSEGEQKYKAEETLTFSDGSGNMLTVKDLERGDVVRFLTANGNIITKMSFLFRTADKTKKDFSSVSTNFRNSVNVSFGMIYDKFEDGFLAYFVDDPALFDRTSLESVKYNDCQLVLNRNTTVSWYAYTEGKENEMVIEETAFSALKSYKDTGSDCSFVIMQRNNSRPTAVLIFE